MSDEPMVTHYVLIKIHAIYVKAAHFFLEQGGLSEEWGKKWEPVCADSIEHARTIGRERLLERENARLRLENAQVLQENLRLRKLVEEVISAHADPESPWYNECSLSSPCAWCDAASAALTAQQPEKEDK